MTGTTGATAVPDVVRLAQQLVRMPSTPESGGQRAIAELLADRLDGAGFAVGVDRYAEGHANVVARWGDPDLPAVCLTGHLDTVSVVESAWSVDPWGAQIRDGQLTGRGSADMKSGVAALLLATEEYVARPPEDPVPVAIVLTGQEEVGSLGAAALAARAGALPPARVLLVAEPTANRPVLGHRGVVWMDVVARGRSCHASTPHLGENAVEKLMDALAGIRAWAASNPRRHDVLGDRTVSIGRIGGGVLRNVVPDAARAELDVRTPEPDDAAELPRVLQELVGGLATVETALSLPPVLTPPDDPWVGLARQAAVGLAEADGPDVARFFTDASVLTPALDGVPTVVCGPGSPDQAHVVGESCPVEQIIAAQEFCLRLLRSTPG